MFNTLLIFVPLLIIFVRSLFNKKFEERLKPRWKWIGITSIFLLILSIGLLDFSWNCEFEHDDTKVITIYNEKKNCYEQPFIAFVWQKPKTVCLTTHILSEVTPITINPKVRKITYLVEFEIDPTYYFENNQANPDSLLTKAKEKVNYWLYEFNNAHSRISPILQSPGKKPGHSIIRTGNKLYKLPRQTWRKYKGKVCNWLFSNLGKQSKKIKAPANRSAFLFNKVNNS